MAKRRKKRAKSSGKAPTTKTACERRGGRWVHFRGKGGGRNACFLHDKATAATKAKRRASLKKARAKSPIGKRRRRRSRR